MNPEEQAMMEQAAAQGEAPAQGGGSPEEMIMQNNQMLQQIGQMVQELGQMMQQAMGGGAPAEEAGIEEGATMEDEALRQEAMARLAAQQG